MLVILSWILYSKAVIGIAFPIVATTLETLCIGYKLAKYCYEKQ